MANKISVLIDAVADKASNTVKSFRDRITEADGAVGKLKAGAGASFEFIRQNAVGLATAAGGAIATFAVKAIGNFQSLALEVDKFAAATGQSAEEASRWVEVAGDIGVSTETVTSAFIKMEKAAADGGKSFADYGIEVAKAADGSVNVTETFLNAVTALQQIPDANARAEASTKLFGRGYAEIAELIDTSASDLRESLASVGDAKVIDEAEIAKAKEMRAAIDNLRDRLEAVALTVGEYLVPAAAAALAGIDKIGAALQAAGITDLLAYIRGEASATAGATTDLFAVLADGESTTADVANAFRDLVDAEQRATGATEAWGELWGSVQAGLSDGNARAALTADSVLDAFQRLAGESPEAAARVLEAMTAVVRAADAGNETAGKWQQSWGLSSDMLSTMYDILDDVETATRAKAAADEFAASALGDVGDAARSAGRDISEESKQQAIAERAIAAHTRNLDEHTAAKAESTRASEELGAATEAATAAATAAAQAYRDGINEAFASAASAVASFAEGAKQDLDAWQDELRNDAAAVVAWQQNLVEIAQRTSPEFASYLASLGPEFAKIVADMLGSSDELRESFDAWRVWAAVAGRDMASEFAKVSPAAKAAMSALPQEVETAVTAAADRVAGTGVQLGTRWGTEVSAGFTAAMAAGVSEPVDALIDKALRWASEAGKGSVTFAPGKRPTAPTFQPLWDYQPPPQQTTIINPPQSGAELARINRRYRDRTGNG